MKAFLCFYSCGVCTRDGGIYCGETQDIIEDLLQAMAEDHAESYGIYKDENGLFIDEHDGEEVTLDHWVEMEITDEESLQVANDHLSPYHHKTTKELALEGVTAFKGYL